MRSDSLAFRLVAGAALWSAIALVAGGLILSAIFRNSVERSFDSRLNVLLHSLIATTEVNAEGEIVREGGLSETRFDLAYSGWYWQIWPVAPRPALRSRSLFDQSLDLSPAEKTERNDIGLKIFDTIGPENQPLRVVERRVTLPGYDVPVSFAVAGERSEMNVEIQSFNTWLFAAMAAMGAGLLVALLIQVRFGLRPLDRVRRSLSQIRTGRATKLEGDFPLEIEPLAEELNGLLEGNREVLERARTHVGNLAHALKTPLSVLTNEARSHKDPFGETVSRMTMQMREQIDRHLARARMAASANVLGAHTPVEPVVGRIARALERIHAERGISIEVSCPPDAGFRGEAQDLEEVVGNLLDNACKWAEERVRLTVTAEGIERKNRAFLLVAVEDDGPGLPESARKTVLQRGARLDETKPGSGLGLSIVTEVANLYGGELKLETSAMGGLRAELYLPATAPLS
ncbi:MAG: ATP-binding protein [Parvibaculum sp.]|uniref:ATP-binding protein n=1 Tax=Parvibaculum sp. TaxID=2024848 RepID=UPI0032ED135A